MANELQAQYTSGKTVYAVILSAVGQAWNGTTFEAPLAADWATYAVAATEQSTTGLYEATMPAGVSTAGLYSVLFYQRAGASPATTDTVIGKGSIEWSGTAEIPRSSVPANVWTNASRTLTAFGFSVTVSGNVTVGGYAANQDPATLLASSFSGIPATLFAATLPGSPTPGTYGAVIVALNGYDALVVRGTVTDAAPTTSSFAVGGLSGITTDYVGQSLCFTSGTLKGRKETILTYTSGKITVTTPFAAAPAQNDTFDII